MNLDSVIKKYRSIIIERLYQQDGYKFDRLVHLSDGYRDVIMVCYVKKRCET